MQNIKKIKLHSKNKLNKKEIPIFFATDDNYICFLDVALRSLIENASKEYNYVINILNTGLKEENKNLIKRQENSNFKIIFRDISSQISFIKGKLKNLYHFSLVAYYRLFIENLFPEYDKILYLDCDIVVLGDISNLYNIKLENNLLGAIKEQVVNGREEFRNYAKTAIGIDCKNYFNSGILIMNLKQFRMQKIEEQFVYLINKYNFDVVDPDQAYLNFLCRNKVVYLPNGWNKASLPDVLEGKLNIAHYALYKKPWQYDNVINDEYFWKYALKSPFYDIIKERKNSFSDEDKKKKENDNLDIVEHALKIIKLDKTFKNVLIDNIDEDYMKILKG